MKIETKYDIASSVNIGAEYDKGVKKLFKSKEIIVPIMEMVIPEFVGCSLFYIVYFVLVSCI